MKQKKLWLLAGIVSIAQFAHSQPLFTYGVKSVTKAEFLKAYNKNPSPNETDRKKALKEYLDLYVNYKLKVQAAYDEKLHEQPTFKYESSNFKKQVADNIINDEANINNIVKEAFLRGQKDIHVAQVFVEIKTGVSEEQAFQQIQKAYEQLKAKKDFGEVAASFSNDESTQKTKGDLGFVTVFTLPYEFENQIYALKPGEFSAPYKSKIGYHIFKHVAERPALGKRKVAQILVSFPPGSSDEVKKGYLSTAEMIYKKAKNGEEFEKLVKEFSMDRASASVNGIMPDIAIGQYSPEFEEQVFGLKKVGDISSPFATSYGYHIVKLIEIMPANKDEQDAIAMAQLKQRVERDDRLTIAKKQLVKKWMVICKYKPGVFDHQEFEVYTDSAAKGGKLDGFKKILPSTVLFSFAKQKITAADWSKFVKAIKPSNSALASKSNKELLGEYEKIVCTEYYHDHLEDFNESLQQQSKEFDEANLLFSAMDKHVWTKAAEDTIGLKAYYNSHSGKYRWAKGISAIVVTCNSKELPVEVSEKLKNNIANWREVVSAYGNTVIADSSRYEESQLPIKQNIEAKVGFMSAAEKSGSDESYTFIYVTAVHNQPGQRSFDEARGLVINDYQLVLEQKWLADLKKKYPVKVNEAVWTTVK